MKKRRMAITQEECGAVRWAGRLAVLAVLMLSTWGAASAAGDELDGLRILRSAHTGRTYFLTAADGGPIPVTPGPAGRLADPREFLAQYGRLFGIDDPATQLREASVNTDWLGRTCTTFVQQVGGVPVFSGVIKVHQDAGGAIVAANGDFYSVPLALETIPSSPMPAAVAAARDSVEDWLPVVEHGELVVVDPGWYGDLSIGPHLAYYLILADLNAGIRQGVFVDAHNGKVLDRWNLIHTARVREVYDGLGGSGLPGVLVRGEGDPPVVPPDPEDANRAYDYAGDVYDYFDRAFGRDSINDAGMTMVLTVNSTRPPCPNAQWNGAQMIFCSGTVTDDITAHEIMHGVTQNTANLIYQNQSGQLNEAYSDIFGELVDLFNGDAAFPGPPGGLPSWPVHATGSGLDAPNNPRSTCTFSPSHADGVRWLMGEDATAFGGAIRDMWDPTCMGDPDRANSPLQTCPSNDSGGVHSGSGIANHAFAILSDGKTFNGQAVTGIGTIKSAAVWYRALTTYLTPASDFEDAYAALNQAAADLVNTMVADPRDGSAFGTFTAADAVELDKSLLAVEMNTPGACGQTVTVLTSGVPTRCANRTMIFEDDFEGGINGWTVSNSGPSGPPTPYDWVQTTDIPLGNTGTAWFASDPGIGNCSSIDESAVHSLFSPPIVLPVDVEVPVLDFTHFLATEGGWDGGNLKASVNGGPWDVVPGSAFLYNPYNAKLNNSSSDGNTNPLENQDGWTGPGGGWGTSIVNLKSLVSGGDTIQLRFDLGKDGCTGVDGWYLHDVQVYDCPDCDISGSPDQLDFTFSISSGDLGNIGSGSQKDFSFSAPTASGDVILSIVAAADLAGAGEFIDVDINGTPVGRVFELGANDCPTAFIGAAPDRAELTIPAATFNAALVAGVADVNLVASSDVHPTLCNGRSFIAVFVEYATDATDCNVNVVPDQCETDCQPNSIPDDCDIAASASEDVNENGVPDECEEVIPPPGAPMTAPYPHDRAKNRYISFDPDKSTNDGRSIAFQVTLDALNLGSCSGNGAPCREDRGDEDCNACSVSGDPCITPADCQPMEQSCDPTGESCVNDQAGSVGMVRWVGPESPSANGVHLLVSEPFRRVSTSWPEVVHVGDCEIVPIAAYSVVAVDVDAALSSTSLAVETIGRPSGNNAWWADGVGPLEGHCEGDLRNPACDMLLNDCPVGQSCGLVWSEPDGAANFVDVLAAIMVFAAQPGAALADMTWVDLHGNDSGTEGSAQFDPPNYVANFADVQFFVLAFQGMPYPFLDPADCPDTGTWP